MSSSAPEAQKSPKTAKKARLGRGLSSLISKSTPEATTPADQYVPHPKAHEGATPMAVPTAETPAVKPGPVEIPVEQIQPNPYQPRRDFDETELQELAQSLKQQGILQPLLVSKKDISIYGESGYILVAGERRLRAARLAGLSAVPCVIRPADTQQMMEWALVENLQRADLNPLERAEGYRHYMDRFKLDAPQVAEKLGQARTTVVNHLRILDLHGDVQELVRQGALSFGHAKVLAGLVGDTQKQLRLAKKAAAGKLSVRQLESAVTAEKAGDGDEKAAAPSRQRPAYIRDMEEQLTNTTGTRVAIMPGRAKNTGRIVVEFYNLDDFDRIASMLGVQGEC